MKYNTPIKRGLIGVYENATVSRKHFPFLDTDKQQSVIECRHDWICNGATCLSRKEVSVFLKCYSDSTRIQN